MLYNGGRSLEGQEGHLMLCSTYHLPLAALPMWVWARGPPRTCFRWASAFSVLGCVAGNLSVESPHHEEVQSGSRRLVFSFPSMDLHYKLVCPAKWKEILIVFSHLSFPNASTSSGVVIKSKTYFKHVLFVFFLE